MSAGLTTLVWLAVAGALAAAVAVVVVKWIALRIAGRVAESAEHRLAASVDQALARGGIGGLAPVETERQARYVAQVQRLAWLMDGIIPLPVVGGIGLDAVIGIAPIAGDVVGFCISAIIVVRAAQLGASREALSRIVAIHCTDLALGAIPGIGDLVDVAYQANVRSLRLIRDQFTELHRTSAR